MQDNSGSSAQAALPPISSRPSTPLARACAARLSTFSNSASSVATISLPYLRFTTPCAAQNSYNMRRPRTQWRARTEPVG